MGFDQEEYLEIEKIKHLITGKLKAYPPEYYLNFQSDPLTNVRGR